VHRTHRMPFRTARRFFHGLPRPSLLRDGSGRRSSKISHCASVRSRVFARGIYPLQDGTLVRPILALIASSNSWIKNAVRSRVTLCEGHDSTRPDYCFLGGTTSGRAA
jgi:hypothetical protein